jgi:4'-phosphopantetheinyl transferase
MIEFPENAVHLWHAGITVSDAEYEQLGSVLNETEWMRARRFLSERHRRGYVAARGQLRWLLSHYLHLAPESIDFTVGEHGKPRLADTGPDQGMVFNLSHTESHLLIAVGRDSVLGIDIEGWREISNMGGMAERCFAPAEQQYWSSLDAAGRTAAFYGFWTCKEAFVKAVGRGISLGLDQCVIGLEPRPHLMSLPLGFGGINEWLLLDIDVGAGVSAALAVRPACRHVFYGELARYWWRHDSFALTARRIQ